MRRLVNVLDEDTDARHQAVMQNLVLEMDNLLTYIDGISDERDSVPLLLAVRRHWPQVKAAIASLKAERDLYYIAAAVEQACVTSSRPSGSVRPWWTLPGRGGFLEG